MQIATIQLHKPRLITTPNLCMYEQIGWYIVTSSSRDEFLKLFPDARFETEEELKEKINEVRNNREYDELMSALEYIHDDRKYIRHFPITQEEGVVFCRKEDLGVVMKDLRIQCPSEYINESQKVFFQNTFEDATRFQTDQFIRALQYHSINFADIREIHVVFELNSRNKIAKITPDTICYNYEQSWYFPESKLDIKPTDEQQRFIWFVESCNSYIGGKCIVTAHVDNCVDVQSKNKKFFKELEEICEIKLLN